MPTLADRLQRRIAEAGPIAVADFMRLALTDAEDGYYMGRDPFGRGGDFITAPEVSQMFGEMVGLWCVLAWREMGRPGRFALVELGPGRGTLMRDVLRAGRVDAAFAQAAAPRLLEISPALRARQRETLAGHVPAPRWLDDFAQVPEGPLIVFANEFFDALPVRQFQMTKRGWRERLVGLGPSGAGFAFTLAAEPPPAAEAPRAPFASKPGEVFETRPAADDIVRAVARRLGGQPGVALIVDYGHNRTAAGDTLQAVKDHRFADPLADPGRADLTAHVDFAALKRAAGAAGAQVFGPVAQGAWLNGLGLRVRADSLKKAQPDRADEIEAAYRRLVAADAMGRLFKALALTSPGLPPPAGFA